MRKIIYAFAVFLAIAVIFSACSNGGGTDSGSDTESDSGSVSFSDSSAVSTSTEGTYPTVTLPLTDPATETSVVTETAEETSKNDSIDNNNQIVQTAETLIGIPFAENGADPSEGFDNSGFIYYVLRENGFINCPRLTNDQAAMGTHIGYDELKSGDLAFFCTADSGNPDFGGIYIGEGQMIYSPMPGQTVKIADITSDYWKNTFVSGISLS